MTNPTQTTVATGDLSSLVAGDLVCDICGCELSAADAADEVSNGKGVFLEFRGDERRVTEVPICPTCATGIGIAQLRAAQMEDEEG